MVKNCLLEMLLGKSAKETDNKLRWDAIVEGVTFSLYVPKWRVPKPWPGSIWVRVIPRRVESDDLPNVSHADVEEDPGLVHEPIIATVVRDREHTETTRFRPVGDDDAWEIGMPYVPKSLVPENAARMWVIVMWDITTRGSFQSRIALKP